ncbi:MAG: hypothetical protein AAGD96_05685 [Chloroflexota bacterium]
MAIIKAAISAYCLERGEMKTYIRFLLLLLLLPLVACTADSSEQVKTDAISIQLIEEDVGQHFEVMGLPEAAVQSLAQNPPNQPEWQALFSVSVAGMAQSMLGDYSVHGDTVRFTPSFPLMSGQAYQAFFSTTALIELKPDLERNFSEQTEIVADFNTLEIETQPTTVTKIYPTADELPSNMLRFYVYFSAPMREGNALEHVALIDAVGNEVEGVFFDPIFELWDPSQQRLTLLFDPGRVKSGLRAHEELGRALVPGEAYTLRIKSTMLDANSNSLEAMYEKSFQVTDPDRSPPDVGLWDISYPNENSFDPINIQFPAPLDHQLVTEFIQIIAFDGTVISGDIELRNQETAWQFVPETAWKAGNYELWVNTKLEDVAGNNLHGLFDIPPEERLLYPNQSEVLISFQID